MSKISKFSRFASMISLLLLPTGLLAGQPDGGVSVENPASFAELQRKFPRHFNGFLQTAPDYPDFINSYRNQDPDQERIEGPIWLRSDPQLRGKFERLLQVLEKREEPALQTLKKGLAETLADPKQQIPLAYAYFCARAAALVSEKGEDEKDFFNAAGFRALYEHMGALVSADTLAHVFVRLDQLNPYNESGQFRGHTEHRTFADPRDQMDKFFAHRNPFRSLPYFMFCSEPLEDVFGFFYLAWAYNKGIHPIPVTLDDRGGGLHGIHMSPWGKLCHDLAHSEIDPADHSVQQFANFLVNYYLTQLKEHLHAMSPEERERVMSPENRKKYGVAEMRLPFARFALAIHTAYRQSVMDVLERSLSHYGALFEADRLPGAFTAFSAGAFHVAHEEAKDMSTAYGTPNLDALLEYAAPEEDASSVAQQGGLFKTSLFKTSFITGASPLSDQEIVDQVLEQPLRSFSNNLFMVFDDSKINKDEVSSWSVSRNRFYIEVTFTMLDGGEHVFRELTNYSRRLNLQHDKQNLRPAQQILRERYSFEIPNVPLESEFAGREADFEGAVEQCFTRLEQGKRHLINYYGKQTQLLSSLPPAEGEGLSIADTFRQRYLAALDELSAQMPPFMGNVQEFVSKAVASETLNPQESIGDSAAAAPAPASAEPFVDERESEMKVQDVGDLPDAAVVLESLSAPSLAPSLEKV